MPLYEYRCRTCDVRFDVRRAVADADADATCPAGHEGAVRLLAAFAATGSARSASVGAPLPPTGGCGGACACAG